MRFPTDKKSGLTLKKLKSLVKYDPKTGAFTRINSAHKWRIGRPATHLTANRKYVGVHLGNKTYIASRLAWFYMTGKWPIEEVDHINGDPLDNRWVNLRQADRMENIHNRGKNKAPTTSKYIGVHWKAKNRVWVASIAVGGGTTVHLGCFSSEGEAARAYDIVAHKHRGKFARLNFPAEVK